MQLFHKYINQINKLWAIVYVNDTRSSSLDET